MNVTSARATGRADAGTPARRRWRGWLATALLIALAGLSLFAGLPKPLVLDLVEATAYDDGSVLHIYRPATR